MRVRLGSLGPDRLLIHVCLYSHGGALGSSGSLGLAWVHVAAPSHRHDHVWLVPNVRLGVDVITQVSVGSLGRTLRSWGLHSGAPSTRGVHSGSCGIIGFIRHSVGSIQSS